MIAVIISGFQFLSGTTVGLELLKNVKLGEAALAKYLLNLETCVTDVQNDMSNAIDKIKLIDSSLSTIISKLEKVEEAQHKIENSYEILYQRQSEQGEGLEELKEGHQVLTNKSANIETRLDNMNIESTEAKATLTRRLDSLNDRVTKIEHYHSLSRPNKIFFTVPDRIRYFTGRKEELQQLEDNFVAQEMSFYIQGISGLGGSGKTSLAIEYAWLMQNYYQGGVFWLSAENTTALENSVTKLAIDAKTMGKTRNETWLLTLKWLGNLNLNWLLIVDNVDEEELSNELKELLMGTWKRACKGHLIVTTRREPSELEQGINIETDSCLSLGPLTPAESITFILTRTGQSSSNESLERIVEELDGLPLALEQAAAHIKTLKCSFKEYLDRFEKKRLKLSQRPVTTNFPVSKERLAVKTTWQINFDYICRQSEEEELGNTAQFVMFTAAYFHADDMPEELMNIGEPEIDDEDYRDVMSDSIGVKQVIDILTRFSLFQRYREGSLQVHRLVQEVVRENLTDVKQKFSVIHGAVKMLNRALSNAMSPSDVLEVQRAPETLKGGLQLWNKLGTTACSLHSHINAFTQKNGFERDLLWQYETIKVFQTAAVFHSIYQRQAEALSSQEQMLRMITLANLSEKQESDLTVLTIPIQERERNKIQACIETTILPQCENGSSDDEPTIIREMGNKAFQEKRTQDAIQLYSEGIRSSKGGKIDPRLFSNRSLCFLTIQDYEKALEDADSCIELEPRNWKAHCWRAYAIGHLIRLNKLPKTMEASGLASASVAGYINRKCKLEFKMKILYPILLSKLVSDSKELSKEFSNILERPYTTLLLPKGRYSIGCIPTTKSVQIIGIDEQVEIYINGTLEIVQPKSDLFLVDFTPENKINVHFENVCFLKGGGQILSYSQTTLSFYRCVFSNGLEGCDDFPHCTGGKGCKNKNPDGCQLEHMAFANKRGSGHFKSGIGGYAGISADTGGHIIIERCNLDGCGGGGALSVGKGSVLSVSNSIVQNHRQSGIEARENGEFYALNNIIKNNHQHGLLVGPYGKAVIQNNAIFGNGSEGIFCCENECVVEDSKDVIKVRNSESKSVAIIENNTISHNGLCGISLDGGTFIIRSNKILDNWCWGIMAKTRSSCSLINNDVYSNKCGGFRIGFNYSAVIYMDGNTIHDHTGPHIHQLHHPKEIQKEVAKLPKKIVRKFLEKDGLLHYEETQYSLKPVITNRNVFRRNDLRIQHPSTSLTTKNACSYCHRLGKGMQSCGRCGKACYCTRECQTNHWLRHKHFCKMFKEKYIVTIILKDTKPFAEDGSVHLFDPSLKGIKDGPIPDRSSKTRFIVKIQSGLEYSKYNPQTELTLYDRSVDLDIRVVKPQLYHLIMECGVLSAQKYTTKKIFCWASFDNGGEILKVYTDNLPPYQQW